MTTEDKPTRKNAFVVSPIGQPGSEVERNANLALKYIFKKAFDPQEWNVHRADDGERPDSIGHHVIRSIVTADLIIADLTDHNPNVFYELAVAHGYRKPVVHLITEGQKIPFDITDQRTISYDLKDPASVDSAITRLRTSGKAALEDPDGLITPLSSFDSFDTLRASLRDKTSNGDALADVLEQITDRMGALESRVASATHEIRIGERTVSGGPMSRASANKEARDIISNAVKLKAFLNGELTDALPIEVLHMTARMLKESEVIDFDPRHMARSELNANLRRVREEKWGVSDSDEETAV